MIKLNENKIQNFSFENYLKFKNIITEKIKELSNFKKQEYENELSNLLKSENKNCFFIEYLCFINYKKLVNSNFDYSIIKIHNNHKLFLEELKNYKTYRNNQIYNNIYKILFHMFLYVIIKQENNIHLLVSNNDDKYIKEINELYNVIFQIIFLILELYYKNIFNLNQVFLFLDTILYFINNNVDFNDKYIKLKNMIFFELFFDFISKILIIILKTNKNKEDISYFFNYFLKFLESNELKSNFNRSILNYNNRIIHNFMTLLLSNFDFNNPSHEEIFISNQSKLIQNLIQIYEENTDSHFFEILINQNKTSFVNLFNYTKNKENIINDIYIQNFYIELLNKLFQNEINLKKNSYIYYPPKNSFIFNGYDSKMTFRLNEFKIDDFIIFFSFQIVNNINKQNCNIPLFSLENASTNEILFKLYIKQKYDKESNTFINNLYISLDKKNDICLNKIENIVPNTNYYLALNFNNKKLNTNVFSSNNIKENTYEQEIEISNHKKSIINLKIGHNNEKEYFKGFIGSFIIIQNLSLKNNSDKKFINNILKLKDFYKYFPYFSCPTISYDFSQIFCFENISNEKLFNQIKNEIEKDVNKFECILYITPELLNLSYSLYDKHFPFVYLPEIPDICQVQKDYLIHDINISLTNFFSTNIEFLKNNGFDYFCLIYEYFYQFANLYILNKNDLNFDFIKLKKLFDNIINETILILQNYNKCKYILCFNSSLKKLFKNLYECLNSLNNICNILTEDITNLYELIFKYKEFAIAIEEENNILENPDLKNIIIPFCDGLIDILFDIDLYKRNEDENIIEILFIFTSCFLSNYINNLKKIKIAPFKPEFFWNIINFTSILENKFTIDYKNKNKTILSFFNLLENYFISIKNQNNCLLYFKNLLQFITSNLKNNLIISYNFLSFMHDMIWKGYIFDNEDILLLLNYTDQYYIENTDKNNQKIINELFSVISCIFVDISFNKESSIILDKIYQKIELFSNNEIIIYNITNEIRSILEGLIKRNMQNNKENIELKCYTDNNSNYMNLYWNIFKFIIFLFKNLIIVNKDNPQNGEIEEEIKNYKIKSQVSYCHLYSLLVNIEEIIRINKYKNKNIINIHGIFCLINFIKFYHYIVFNEKEILQFMDKAFVDNIFQVVIFNSKSFHLINYNQLFVVSVNNFEYKKTIVEMIFEIYIQYFLNNNNSFACYKIFLTYHSIFYDNEIEENKKHTIFYVNDYIRYLLNKKGLNENENNILLKYRVLKESNFNKEFKFDCNYTTFFLLKLGEIQYIFKKSENFKKYTFISKFNNVITNLYKTTLEEHLKLAELKKECFFKTNNAQNYYYNELIKLLKNKFIKKKKSSDIDEFFETNLKEFSAKAMKNIITDSFINNLKENEKNKINKKDSLNKKESKEYDKNVSNDKIENQRKKSINNEPISLQQKLNKLNYFNEIDINYLKNPKKEIMNNIFSLFYIDVFYYNKYFVKMKKLFINKYLSSSESNTKQLNFPSKLKNYSNNLEPPLFIKQYNDYFNDPIFPITHSYLQENNKNIVENHKSIKLFQKKLSIIKSENANIFECELIKQDNYYFGNILINPDNLIFNEQDINLDNYEKEYKYIFMLSYLSENEQKKNPFNNKEKNYYKSRLNKKLILLIFNEIEEIVERRVFLLWKAVEIYLKNGKSYIFNFLNTSEYDNFMKIIKNSNTIKNLIRKKDFIRSEKKITNEWKKGALNNYEYILLLNKYSGRSYNDNIQYPIFPWLLKNYEKLEEFNENKDKYEKEIIEYLKLKSTIDLYNVNKNNNFIQYETLIKESKSFIRKFKYPPSLQNKEKREIAIAKYIDSESYEKFPSHSGCHYSTSAYIYFYLMRQQPYCNSLVKLQGYNLENTNRCFLSLISVEKTLESGMDNRELIPEFFSKVEGFLNLNCDFYGYSGNGYLVNDVIFDNIKTNQISDIISKYPLTIYCHFIIEHKKLLNSKIIGYYINKWIDNIFGINQLPPEKQRRNSCNIFPKYSYEQNINLENKLNKNIKNGKDEKEIRQKMNLKITHMMNFGQTPYQIFQEAHPELTMIKNEIDQFQISNIFNDELNETNDDLESIINHAIKEKNLDREINGIPIYFQINPSINKIFIYNLNEDIEIINCQLFNRNDFEAFGLTNFHNLQKSNIFIYGITNDKYQYLIYKLKYSFNSFEIEKSSDIFHTYYTDLINQIKYKHKTSLVKDNSKKGFQDNIIIFKFITCRHIDCCFKIYLFKKKNKKEKERKNKMFSFICEDFITSCCTISSNHFILGLKNGKLILYSIDLIEESINDTIKKNKNKNIRQNKIKLNKIRYIKGHHGKVNMIEINKKIGVIITAGDDNYIFVRKLYDFELLLPIKIKNKYIILMAKISSFNFLYILCYNKVNNKTVIFGYTLSGLKFAKSEYGIFDNLSFTENGNIVTMNNKEEVIVFSGSDLTRINILEDEEAIKTLNKIKGSSWMQFDSFYRANDDEINKILTFFYNENNDVHKILTLNTKNIKYFD